MTITEAPLAADLHGLAAHLDASMLSTLPAPRVELAWHDCDDDAIRTIVAALPDLRWVAHGVAGGTQWVEAGTGRIRFIAFAKSPAYDSTPRLAAVIAEVSA